MALFCKCNQKILLKKNHNNDFMKKLTSITEYLLYMYMLKGKTGLLHFTDFADMYPKKNI